MLKRVLNFIQKDFTSAMRNNVVIYGSLFPILLAIGLSLFLPGVQSMKLTVAIDGDVEQKVIEGWKKYANVEVYDSRDKVQKRVEKPDDVAGVVKKNSEYVILLEGNETGEAKEIATVLLDAVLSGKLESQYEHISLGKTNSGLREVSASILLLTAILIGGFIIGFNIVDEKETKAIKALAVSPLKLGEFLVSHALVCLISGIVLAFISSLIFFGTGVNYLWVLVSIICSTGVGMVLGFIIGGFADSLISAIAIVKVVMLFFVGIPIGSLFVPMSFQWIFFIFPHYWAFQSYRNIYGGSNLVAGFGLTNILALTLSLIALVLLVPTLKKRLKLR